MSDPQTQREKYFERFLHYLACAEEGGDVHYSRLYVDLANIYYKLYLSAPERE